MSTTISPYSLEMGICIAAFFCGVLLLFLGRRGKRVNDHPVCRRCGYDLTGLPNASTRCAECGANLHRAGAVQHGQRKARGGLVAIGTLVLLPSLVCSIYVGRQAASAIEW